MEILLVIAFFAALIWLVAANRREPPRIDPPPLKTPIPRQDRNRPVFDAKTAKQPHTQRELNGQPINLKASTMLVEAGRSYRHPPKEGYPYLKRSVHLRQQIKDTGWKAQTRLCKRYRHLSRTGKPHPRVFGGNCAGTGRVHPGYRTQDTTDGLTARSACLSRTPEIEPWLEKSSVYALGQISCLREVTRIEFGQAASNLWMRE